MAKKDNNGLFGDFFDFDGDGKISWAEEMIGYAIMKEVLDEEEAEDESNPSKYLWRAFCEDGSEYDISPEDYETKEEYNDALEEARSIWRLECEDGTEYGIYPEDYKTEQEYNSALKEARTAWRDTCEDGSEYGIDPEDYETEEEYNDALEEERTAWRDTCEDGFAYNVDPENYDTEEEYNIALEEAKAEQLALEAAQYEVEEAPGPSVEITIRFQKEPGKKPKEPKLTDYLNKRLYNAACVTAEYPSATDEESVRCRFITENANKIVAASYLTTEGDFLYAQAIKDHFTLPCSLPNEDEQQEMMPCDILSKIAKRNIPLSFDVWAWCVEQFLPYAQYDPFTTDSLCVDVMDNLDGFPDGYTTKLVHYLNDHPPFMNALLSAGDEPASNLPDLVFAAITEGLLPIAEQLFAAGLQKGKWKHKNAFTLAVIDCCENYDELESIEYFRDHLLPLVKAIPDGMVQDEIAEWEEKIAKYIDEVEDTCEQYAYTRKNAWRKNVPDGKAYDVDPTDHPTEQEYLDALNKAKYRWRSWYDEDERLGLDPNAYETQEEFRHALDLKRKEKRNLERRKSKELQPSKPSKQKQARQAEQAQQKTYADDKTIYTYCGVLFPFSERPYSFRTEDETIQIGDQVVAPMGDGNTEMIGTVVSIGKYTRQVVPYPVEKTKMITRKLSGELL